jgi:hypothetical protein
MGGKANRPLSCCGEAVRSGKVGGLPSKSSRFQWSKIKKKMSSLKAGSLATTISARPSCGIIKGKSRLMTVNRSNYWYA